ncbi:hypothetical protein DFH28DRAFT_1078159 [Melampsora americana]|nr:hypothetical protein DFH28DRAFT_1078159 [Melampsora americana]
MLAGLLQADETHTSEYFKTQWAWQREMQLRAISEKSKQKFARLEVFLKLEEELLDACKRMTGINAGNAPIRTAQQRHQLLRLPNSLALLEQQMQRVVEDLGNSELLNVRHGTVTSAITVQVAMGLLYEAKFDVVQQQADAAIQTGTTNQPRNETLRKKKRLLLKTKTKTYLRHARKYNQCFRPHQPIPEPSFEEISEMDILDPFWNEAALNHPDEPWATCHHRSSEEELRRLGCKVRQMMRWAVDYQAQVKACKPSAKNGELRLIEWRSLYSGLSRQTCRLWKRRERGLHNLIKSTARYVDGSADMDTDLFDQWQAMVARTSATWADILGVPIFWMEDEEEEPEVEQDHHELLEGLALAWN